MCRIQLKRQIMMNANRIVGRFSIDVKYFGARNGNILKAAAIDCVQSQKNHGSVVALLSGKFLQKSGKFLQ